jgi:zinc D-Ala-D-Ala carboxypeptidase
MTQCGHLGLLLARFFLNFRDLNLSKAISTMGEPATLQSQMPANQSMPLENDGMCMAEPQYDDAKGMCMAPPNFSFAGPEAEAAGGAGATTAELDDKHLTGQFDPANDPDFVKVEGTFYLRREAAVAWNLMQSAASADGIRLSLVSATRNYADQKRIWNNKWTGKTKGENGKVDYSKIANKPDRSKAIMKWSSMPGTSRHHWGTDIDINSVEASEWKEGSANAKAYTWLMANGAKYGWSQTYDKKAEDGGKRSGGYSEERWHWSYIPLAGGYQKSYAKNISNEDVAKLDFQGAATAKDLDVVKNYVDNVSAQSTDLSKYKAAAPIGTVTIDAATVKVFQDPKAVGKELGILKKGGAHKYYKEEKDKSNNIWVLVEAGWFMREMGGKSMATKS